MRLVTSLCAVAVAALFASTSIAVTPPTKPAEKPLVAPQAQIIRPGETFISKFDPPKAPAGSSGKVTIYGAGFASCRQYEILFTGASGKQDVPGLPTAKIDTAIDVSAVPQNARTGKVAFVCQNPQKTVLSVADFVVPENITLTAVKPASAPRGGRITIYGTKFSPWDSFTVRFSVRQAGSWPPASFAPVPAKKVTDTALEVVVPASASSGVLQVSGFVNGTQASTFAQSTFSLDVPVPLVVSGFASPQALPGRGAVLRGSGFLNQPEVAAFFTGAGGQTTEAAPIAASSRSDTEMTLTVPSGARTGPVRLVVGTGAATQSATTVDSFRVLGPVQVTDVQPRSGQINSTVTITGSGFLNRSVVSVAFWNGSDVSNQSATVVTKADDTLTVRVPGGTRGTGKILVTSGLGTDFENVSSAQDFTVLPPTLAVTDIQPASAPRGAAVTISGQFHDYPTLTVLFSDGSPVPTLAAVVGSRTDSALVVTVPSGAAGTGRVAVSGALGSGLPGYPRTDQTLSAGYFTVSAPPVPTPLPMQVTDVQPRSGALGSTVTISGTNFLGRSALTVFFGNGQGVANQLATVLTKTNDVVTVLVPQQAGSGPIQVVSGTGADFQAVLSPQSFTVTP